MLSRDTLSVILISLFLGIWWTIYLVSQPKFLKSGDYKYTKQKEEDKDRVLRIIKGLHKAFWILLALNIVNIVWGISISILYSTKKNKSIYSNER